MLRSRASKTVVFSDNRAAEVPRYPGQLSTTFGTAPIFRTRIRGYDRVQVDNYVAWVEDELLTQRRTVREVIGQFREAVAQQERSRRLPVRSAEAQQLLDVTANAERILASAADEAADLLSTAAAEADRVATDAHRESRARLERARVLRQRVSAWCDTERQHIEADRTEARRLLAEARTEAARLVEEGRRQRAEEDRAAEQERARAAEEASAHLAAVGSQVERLQGQWHDLVARFRSTDGLVARALSVLDREASATVEPVQQLPRSA